MNFIKGVLLPSIYLLSELREIARGSFEQSCGLNGLCYRIKDFCMLLIEIVNNLSLTVLSGNDLSKNVTCGYISDILSDVMAKSPKTALWITNQTHENILALVYFKGLSGIILPEGLSLESAAIEKAREKNIPVFSSEKAAFDIAGQLYELGLRGTYL